MIINFVTIIFQSSTCINDICYCMPSVIFQHRGFGRELLSEAERITKEEYSINKINVISGVGVREYYRNLGYNRYKWYMSKEL